LPRLRLAVPQGGASNKCVTRAAFGISAFPPSGKPGSGCGKTKGCLRSHLFEREKGIGSLGSPFHRAGCYQQMRHFVPLLYFPHSLSQQAWFGMRKTQKAASQPFV